MRRWVMLRSDQPDWVASAWRLLVDVFEKVKPRSAVASGVDDRPEVSRARRRLAQHDAVIVSAADRRQQTRVAPAVIDTMTKRKTGWEGSDETA